MIRTRLSIAFALLALIAVAQCAFVFWSTHEAARAAERSVVATNLLNQYLELSANKQRLKVWLAESTISRNSPIATRDALITRMQTSLASLSALAARNAELGAAGSALDLRTVADLSANFLALKSALAVPPSDVQPASPAAGWAATIDVFDRYEGNDMRTVLQDAAARQREAAHQAEHALASALTTTQHASAGLAVAALLLGVVAVLYFIRQIQRPFSDVLAATDAIASDQYPATLSALSARRDEFGRIGQHLDAMAAKLTASTRESEAVRAGLDAAVASRTEALTRSHDALLRLDARRRRFFADVSHELRTPVTVIRGEAEVALRQRAHAEEEYRAALTRIVDAADGLGNRVQELLSLARNDALNETLVRTPLPLTAVVRQVVASIEAIAANRRISVALDVPSASEEVVVEADRDRLTQVLVIVLDNAIRYSPTGSAVQVSVVPLPHTVRLVVRDHGIGIAADERELVFERHYRGREATRLRPEGAGLGLSIARDIVLQHLGDIRFESADGELGTTVVIELPRFLNAPQAATNSFAAIETRAPKVANPMSRESA